MLFHATCIYIKCYRTIAGCTALLLLSFDIIMESLDFEELKNVVRRLLLETRCPVCFISLHSPVRLCTNGHGVCAACRPALEHCPLCREPFSASSSKSVLLNGMLDCLPHTCRWKGCEVLVMPEDDHEIWCGYQETVCEVPSCKWTCCGKDILEHIKANHNEITISGTNSNWRLKGDLIQKDGLYFVITGTAFAQENYFWMFTKELIAKKLFVVGFKFFPNGNTIRDFQITLVLGDSIQYYSSSLKVIPKEQFIHSDIEMTFTSYSLHDVIDGEGYLCFSLKVAYI